MVRLIPALRGATHLVLVAGKKTIDSPVASLGLVAAGEQ